jgi:hypothetical protein
VQRILNSDVARWVANSRLVSQSTGLLHDLNNRLFDLSMRLFASPAKDMAGGRSFAPTTFDWSRAGHVFRDALGHVNPTSVATRERYASLFEAVAADSNNLRVDIKLPAQAVQSGVQLFTRQFRNGQVWVYVRDGKIINAGVNLLGDVR